MKRLRDPSPRMRLGVRLVLGAIVVATIVVLLRFPQDPAGWAVVALVVVLGDTIGQSFQSAIGRIWGSVVGCLVGAAVSVLLAGVWLPLRVTVAVAVAYIACVLLPVGAGLRLGVALAGFFVFVPGSEEAPLVGWRLAATILGILAALAIEFLLWPRRSGDALASAVSSSLTEVADRAADELDSWVGDGEGSGRRPPPASVDAARMRALLAESRSEPVRGALTADRYSEVIAGIDTAQLGLRRLVDNVEAGPAHLQVQVADEVRQVAARLRSVGAALARFEPADIGDVDGEIYEAIERMRSRHVTQAAAADEIVRMFTALNALSLIAEGFRRVAAALRQPA